MGTRMLNLCAGLSAFCLASAVLAANLAEDASFESPLPPWFAERSGTSYYAGKELVGGALDGRKVLAVQAWNSGGSRILSAPVTLAGDAGQRIFSATVGVRSFGEVEKTTVELALFDGEGKKRLSSFRELSLDGRGEWRTLSRAGVELDAPVQACRLAIVVRGPYEGARVEVDCVGLFAGGELEAVTNNCDLVVLEAEELADGTVWKVVDHYGGWYGGTPSGMKMLAGFDGIGPDLNKEVSRAVTVNVAGPHTLWFRLLKGTYLGGYTVAVRQNGEVRAAKEVSENDPAYGGGGYTWVWDSIPVDLEPGQAEIVLARPERGASWVTRKLDLFVLTNSAGYEPKVEHFRPSGYMRFTNLSEGVEPFCLWIWVRRHQAPWYANPGMLTLAGLSNSYYVDRDKGKWLAPGQTTPWVRLSDYLLMHGGRNNVQLNATRKQHTDGFVPERVRGRLEFAAGEERNVIRAIDVDQQAPRVLLTIPADFALKPDEIRTPGDYLAETEAEIAKLGTPKGKLSRHLNLCALLSLQVGRDDPEIIRREIDVLKALGFNQTYYLIASADEAVDFYTENGLLTRFMGGPSMWRFTEGGSQWHPMEEKFDQLAAKYAADNAPALKHMVRYKLMDEPGGMGYEAIVSSEPCQARFVEWLKAKGQSPETLGAATWGEVKPVLPADSAGKERLFYYTGLFRLGAFANHAKACVAAKKKHLPDSMLTYVNYSPPSSGGSWTERGTDLFLAQREGGMEMIWTEDWLGYSAGPQHLSHILAICRAAGKPFNRPLGAYWVGQGTPALMRMKFYTLLAGGVTSVCCYSYGPWYAGIDSWARKFELYGAIRDCQFEAGAIEDYLQSTARRKTDVAILYNRTSDIWLKGNNSAYRNACYTHWALAHAGYDAEFLPEEDIEAGLLDGFKVLYVDGPWIRREAAIVIADWVRQGGVLMGSVGAASRDQFDQPMDTLGEVFGAGSTGLEIKHSPTRPKYEMRSGKVLDKLSPVAGPTVPAAELNQLFVREQLAPGPGAEVILSDGEGRPAGVVSAFGRGLAVRIAALPALSYIHEALQGEDVNVYLPKAFSKALRDFIVWPARKARAYRVAEAESPIAEIVRYDGADHAVVFVIDHNAEPTDRFAFELFDAAGFTKAFTAAGVEARLAPRANGVLEISLPMNVGDAIMLTRP